MANPGSIVNPAVPPMSADERDAFTYVVTPHLSDNMSRNIGVKGLQRINKTGKLIGTALTVKVRGGDNLLVYKAMTMIQPGHVLVIDAQGDENNAVIGELIKLDCVRRGCVGFIVDGAIRDAASFENTPCYARSIIHKGPFKNGPGEINTPVCVGGQVIAPGDIIVGDEDGIVCFAYEFKAALVSLAAKHAEKEEQVKQQIAAGDASWYTDLLQEKGYL
ncbi:RraA family protein [Dickeya solani]|uniref:Putative 4-hydroxy-4-methyl-2-oxoglutarate aldolase n=1 Tax=Dickeya solani D s0432-1 TaxID=1231725 RepID=A0AAV3K624_9GAMM|nr:RraA family protein [Dickeya solani]ANE74295.1 methyltransferase [Dickeya solani IPO 2222]AUC41508.1 Dimethylmenaquinone methyltransferase family protein [Dickeya solani RNS 08.23.3.1.A]AUH10291.1 methyltransferase [Dickeya solani D s0432-1]AUH14234.1 methyltransferase [Dickeya solani]AYQ48754.1 4-hydroxy-4-methyl-2-oxoglutarate aldolase [Dickeya solani]